ncbi:Oxidation resistance protein 1 [Pleurostoma richardsiae]|uniref:Oxidation resistance protein 1 n=1 Tax=Pleurostoma richardsiae TaxID=41990 RepID=A0AA38VEL2_9PEZI|nr:Oxidation resistance protein 1 [Pleurostoma richardsiae]
MADRSSRSNPHLLDDSPHSSGAATPTTASASSSNLLPSSLSSIVGGFGGLIRRFSSDVAGGSSHSLSGSPSSALSTSRGPGGLAGPHHNGVDGVYTPPILRTASPMRPPPLEPLELKGFRTDTASSARLLTPTIAEEIRIMIPERQRIEDVWNLVYSLDQDGASLGTLYKKCAVFEKRRASFVLVVRDNEGGVFGAYLSEAPHPSSHYFGNGECFLWRASVLASLPPPPSADTTNLTRATTIASDTTSSIPPLGPSAAALATKHNLSSTTTCILHTASPSASTGSLLDPTPARSSGTSSPAVPPSPSIRFKAFPYSGVNEFYIYCEAHWLSIGGGDGHYGLWLDDSLEKGVSSRCLTFGNEPLSDEGEKFGVLGVEVWVIGHDRP